MVPEWESRTATLLGEEAMERLRNARVLVVGAGGVGGYVAETLARTGVGHLTLVDADCVAESNLNRQLIATRSALGKPKTELFAARFRDINPEIEVEAVQEFVTTENAASLMGEGYDFVIDAIDTVAPKVAVILHCLRTKTPIISSMGAGGRVDPTRIIYADISETREDGLARAVRQRLKQAGIRRGLRVVTSTEAPRRHAVIPLEERNKRSSFGTTMTVPAIFGIYMANYAILRIADKG